MTFGNLLTVIFFGYLFYYAGMISYDQFFKKEAIPLEATVDEEEIDISDEAGEFHPVNIVNTSCRYNLTDHDLEALTAAIKTQKRDILVMADSDDVTDFNGMVAKINAAFETILPEKSTFEI